ncbi:hypothetical protein NP493_42g09044 [Ridgeia piscesae]|uniref:Transketolase-like pyrimidine-binding domain-containing protein n=1 Tax=Ridgeia piscesae TaxID=27915 RepID=A0AAD9UJK9_RIDPI|nr:hypothetical protein NP493_42g09044 [Ridgeia piscesae]
MWHRRLSLRLGKQIAALPTCVRLPQALCYHTEADVYGNTARRTYPREERLDLTSDDTIDRCRLLRLVDAYREHGHKKATLDPLGLQGNKVVPELCPSLYGLSPNDTTRHNVSGLLNTDLNIASTSDLVAQLEGVYCGTLSAQFQHLSTREERRWFGERFEEIHGEELTAEEKIGIATLMLKAQAFDHFLASKFGSVKRYGGEGAESGYPFYQQLFQIAAAQNIHDVVISIAHRGRLNLLTCLLQLEPVLMFRKMKGKSEFPPEVHVCGDVLSHLYASVDLKFGADSVHVSLLPNPSHLEAANSIALGKTRAREQSLCSGSYCSECVEPSYPGEKVLCLQIHGDAAFTGQGVVAETLVLADVPHFTVGGSVHFIINNQIGYTTEANHGRSSLHCTDVALMNGCPIIHVNGDHPEQVVKACRLAMAYRHKYHRDVFVNYVCYRRWGHNEMDEPAFTQPLMYRTIRTRPSIPDRYVEKLQEDGVCDPDTFTQAVTSWTTELQDNLKQVDTYVPQATYLKKQWSSVQSATDSITRWDTGVDTQLLQYIGAKSVAVPADMTIHPTLLKTHVERRLQQMEQGSNIDWGTAEALALGSLLYQGFHVRLSGQDVGRGTFSHRHVMLVDQETDAAFVPFNSLMSDQTAFLEMANSPLSEEAVVAFEYGMSIEHPQRLVIWEAQFGDFHTGAQIIIDTCLTGGETKWMLQSGLVMLLPHGLDGAGPEHSSCRIERFLQLSDSKENGVDGDNVNVQIVNPTTPAQYYHLLRRQMVRNFRKPLVVAAPKTLLRSPVATSQLSQMAPGTSFQPVLGDTHAVNKHVTRVVFVSGKHYYTLQAYRELHNIQNTAIIRVESLCPFPAEEIQRELMKYANAKEFLWSQEEHSNQGAWTFIAPRFENVVGKKLRYAGRGVLATPAAGIGEVHKKEAEQLLTDAFMVAKQ